MSIADTTKNGALGVAGKPEETPAKPSGWANSGPLCLIAFGVVTFMFSLVNAESVSSAVVPVIISTGLIFGGTTQLIGGLIQIRTGDTLNGALFPGSAMTAYCASKHGVIGLVRAAALDLAPHGVTCNAVNPGWVRTQMAETAARVHAERHGVSVEEIWARRTAEYAAGRLPTAEEVADTIRFLAGPRAAAVSGETITVAIGSPW